MNKLFYFILEGQDKLMLTVLKSIPSSVRDKGVVPESVLKEKYKEVYHIF